MNAVKKGLSIVRHIEFLYGEHSSIFSVTLQRSSWVLSVHGSSAPGVGGADGGGVGGSDGEGDGGGGEGDGGGGDGEGESGKVRVHVAPFAQVAGAMPLKLSSPSAKMRAVLVVESVCAPPEHADVHSSGAYVPPSQYSTVPAHPSSEGLLICTRARES